MYKVRHIVIAAAKQKECMGCMARLKAPFTSVCPINTASRRNQPAEKRQLQHS